MKLSRRTVAFGAATVAAGAASAQPVGQGSRVALVIANGDYRFLPPLVMPRRDGELVRDALAFVGFDVQMHHNAGRAQMLAAFDAFARRLRSLPLSAVGFVYYGGQAVGVKETGQNYLFPTDWESGEGIQLDRLLDALGPSGHAGQRQSLIVVIDACGTAVSPRPDMLIATASLPDVSALDDSGYAPSLARHLVTPGADAASVFSRVTVDVVNHTQGQQRPRFDSALVNPVRFLPAGPTTPVAPIPEIRDIGDDEPSFVPAPQKRVGLIIANELYLSRRLGALPGTQRDADVVSSALRHAGFAGQQLSVRRNLNRQQMVSALNEFYGRLRDAEDDALGFLYFSGHGIADDARGRNFLIPVDAEISRPTDLPNAGLLLDDQIIAIETARPRAAVVVIDACRSALVSFARGGRSTAPVPARPGMLLGFSTSPGDDASDDGLYGRLLAQELVRPGRDIETMFSRLQRALYNASGQIPELSNRLVERIVLTRA